MEPAAAPLKLSFGTFELDEANARLSREGVALTVAPRAFDVLCTLLRTPGNLVTKDQLLDAVWGHRHVSESVLKTTISELRGVLQDDARAPRYVETASRRGYRFIAALAPGAAAALPTVPPAAVRATEATLVGRRAQLERLRELWAAAATGPCQVCWIAGEAGIGKTTLIDALAATLGPVAQAHGQCVEQFGAGEPYLPVLDALAVLCRSDPALVELLRATAPGWLLQMPWLTGLAEHEQLRNALGAGSQERMLREFAQFVERCTLDRPLLLVTEDLHWCDDATVRLLDYLARRRTPARLLWLGSYRIAELAAANHPLNGLRHELRSRRLAHELLLEPFSETELAEYLAQRLPAAAVQEDVVHRIHDTTDGLPLFVANVVEDLAAQPPDAQSGTQALPGGAWPLPQSLVGVVERQIARLPPETARLLEAAAVCGVQFGVGLLAEVLARAAGDVSRSCDALVRTQEWIAPGTAAAQADGSLDMQHAFRHALYRQVFYERIGALERAALHRRVAEALERRRAAGMAVSAAELAMHCERGLDLAGALRAYVAAVDHALGRFAPSEALRLVAQAMPLLPQCPDAALALDTELALSHLAGAAHAQSVGISSPQAGAAFRRAAELSAQRAEAPNRPWVLTGLAWMHTAHGEYRQALEVGEQLLQFADGHADPMLVATACCVNAVSLLQTGELQRARGLLEQAVAATEGVDAHRLHNAVVLDAGVMSRTVGATLLAQVGEARLAGQWLQQGIARAEAIGQPIARAFSLRCAAMIAVRLDEPERLHALASRMVALVGEQRLGQGRAPSEILLGWAEARLGQPREGYRRIVAACAAQQAMRAGFDLVHAWRLAAEAARLAQDREAAAAHLAEGLAQAQALQERLHRPDLLRLRGELELEAGAHEAARASLRAAVEEARAMGALLAELEARVALCRLPGTAAAEFAAVRRLRERLAEEPLGAPLQRADAVLAVAPRRR